MSQVEAKKHFVVVVLLHYPMLNRKGETVATSITNIDLHDISRSSRTYEVDATVFVTPIPEQRALMEKITGFWEQGKSREWHPDRNDAFSRFQLLGDFAEVLAFVRKQGHGPVEVVMPDARDLDGVEQVSAASIRKRWENEPVSGTKIIVFGTGWGIAPEFFSQVDTFTKPIFGPLGRLGYNHLSVRAATAILLDRLFGERD
jgi:hypothetical protein